LLFVQKKNQKFMGTQEYPWIPQYPRIPA